jgi:hypothetical protein
MSLGNMVGRVWVCALCSDAVGCQVAPWSGQALGSSRAGLQGYVWWICYWELARQHTHVKQVGIFAATIATRGTGWHIQNQQSCIPGSLDSHWQ